MKGSFGLDSRIATAIVNKLFGKGKVATTLQLKFQTTVVFVPEAIPPNPSFGMQKLLSTIAEAEYGSPDFGLTPIKVEDFIAPLKTQTKINGVRSAIYHVGVVFIIEERTYIFTVTLDAACGVLTVKESQ